MNVYLFGRESYPTQQEWENVIRGACAIEGIAPETTRHIQYGYRAALAVTRFMGVVTVVTLNWDHAGFLQGNADEIKPGDCASLYFHIITPTAFYASQGVTAANFYPDTNAFYERMKSEPHSIDEFGKLYHQFVIDQLERWFTARLNEMNYLPDK